MVLVADRNFCTSRILFGIVQRSAFFVIRQHGSNLSWEREGKRRRIGRTATGMMFEQTLDLNYEGQTLPVRRLTIELDGPTNQGESEVHILTNLPAETVPAGEVVEAYRLRWTIEEAFQCLTEVLRCEVETLGYPRAALLSFAVAVVAWNTYAVVAGSDRPVARPKKAPNFENTHRNVPASAGVTGIRRPPTYARSWNGEPGPLSGLHRPSRPNGLVGVRLFASEIVTSQFDFVVRWLRSVFQCRLAK
ncbi:transposase [Planctomyces sp. SH-PL14]|uniref:transposase n=1 Tax=Planctomyces sp. SH-PL14 TaxID=1632864 RepID=UPI00078D8342|nr:transposase [Planctomyces sp. SH-PL14]AMV16494.1 Transposase DDE domain protein [Planctomyces sp. SH-PL14]